MATIETGAHRTTSSLLSKLRLAFMQWIYAGDMHRAEVYDGDRRVAPLSSIQGLPLGHRVVVHYC